MRRPQQPHFGGSAVVTVVVVLAARCNVVDVVEDVERGGSLKASCKMASSDGGRPAREVTGLLATIIAIVQTLLGALLGINLPPQGAGTGGSRQAPPPAPGADRDDSDSDADADTEDEVTPLMDPFEELGLEPKGAGGCGACHTVSRSGCMDSGLRMLARF